MTVKEEPQLEIYYDYVYKVAKSWVKYGIPISFIDPVTKYRLEGLIYGPKKRKQGQRLSVLVHLSFDSLYLQSPVKVDCNNIFPSRRKLTRMTDQITETLVSSEYKEEEKALTPISYLEVKNVYEAYKGVNWTIPELCSILNRLNPEEIEKVSKLPFLAKVSKRSCRITNDLLDTYKFDTPEPLTVVDRSNYSIARVYEEYKNCKKCPLSEARIASGCSIVPGRGNKTNPKLFIIGEAPGTQERDTGIPFYQDAPAGSALLKVMNVAGIDQEIDCYMTNSILCWPPPEDETKQNGKPSDESISLCNSRLKLELAILKPKVVLLLGAVAYKAFYGRFLKGPISNSLGWQPVNGDYKVYMLFHPSYVIRQLSFERDASKKQEIKKDYLEHFKEIKNEITIS